MTKTSFQTAFVAVLVALAACNDFENPNAVTADMQADASADTQADNGQATDAAQDATQPVDTQQVEVAQEVTSVDAGPKPECAQDADCNDNNPCTGDICVVGGVCKHVAIAAACDDNNACTDNDTCNAGACKGTAKVCDDNNPCTDDFCVNGVCAHGINTVGCDDNNACTAKDTCDATKCVGAVVECDDNNPCTIDTCDTVNGCTFTPVVCEDNDACTTDTCDKGYCQFVQKVCDDGKAWTYDWCSGSDYYGQPGSCVSEEKWNACGKDTDCEDGNKCTINVCDSIIGTCKTVYENCNDYNPCTTDSCVPAKGCVVMVDSCDDFNPNTSDSCDKNGACVHTPITVPPSTTPPTADIKVTIGCSDAACEPFLFFGIANGPHLTTSGAGATIEFPGSKAEFCMWGAQVATRVALSLNPVQPWYGCDSAAPASKSVLNIAINGVPVPKPYSYISKPNICLGAGEGNIVLPKALFGCP